MEAPVRLEKTINKKTIKSYERKPAVTIQTFINWLNTYNPQLLQNEDDVETKFVIPLFTHLGYPEHCRRGKYPIRTYNPGDRGRKPEIDQVYFSTTNPDDQNTRTSLVIVEAKEPQKNDLDEDIAQAKFYGYYLRSPYLVITNGHKIKVLRRYSYDEKMIFDLAVTSLKEEEKASAVYEILNFEAVKHVNEYVVNTPELLSFDSYSPPITSFFFGREPELASLEQAVQLNNVVIIGGISGIGKTYLVAEFVQKFKDKHPIVWLECGPTKQLEQFVAGLAHHFQVHFNNASLYDVLHSPGADEEQRVKSVIELFNAHSCIVVWDGFNQITNKSFLPLLAACSNRSKGSKLLITTREWIEMDDYDSFNVPYSMPLVSQLGEQASIQLLKRLGLTSYSDEILKQVHQRLDGHPKLLTILAGLTKRYSLRDLLEQLPHVTNQIYKYLEQKVFDGLEITSEELLKELSLLRIPFQISVLNYLTQPPECYAAFDILLNRFIVSLQNQEEQFYVIHDLIKEFSATKIPDFESPAIHKKLYAYYNSLPQKRYQDYFESIFHARNADMLDEAYNGIKELLGAANYFGAYDLVLKYTDELLIDARLNSWGGIYHVRGRALRFKERFIEALEAYQIAADLAVEDQDKEKAKLEIANVLVMRAEQTAAIDFYLAKKYYSEMVQSSDLEIRIYALSALSGLKIKEGDSQGIEEMKMALSLAEDANMLRHIAYLYHSLGQAYQSHNKDNDLAIQYYEKSRSIQIDQDRYGPANPEAWYATHLNLIDAYSKAGRFAEAVEACQECVKLNRALGLEKRLAKSLHHLGREQCKFGKYKDARIALLESLSLVEKYNIEEGAKRATYEWLTVAFWYLGEYEKAIEYGLDYIQICIKEGKVPNPHPVMLESSLIADADFTDIYKMGGHMLVLPSLYTIDDFSAWFRNLIVRRPDLDGSSLGLFYKSNQESRIGRNASCPCGSGKKYKHCHGKKSK